MTAKISKRLVIDASVARSCGPPDATYPTSVNCRDFLQAVLTICHRIVMTPDIREEWDKHQSRFAKAWLRSMVARKKLEVCNISFDESLWNHIEATAQTDKNREAMVKDLRLLEAAISTDKIVISLDENTARKLFRKAALTVDSLKSVVWVNPDKAEETPLEWLKDGAPPDPERMLSFNPSKERSGGQAQVLQSGHCPPDLIGRLKQADQIFSGLNWGIQRGVFWPLTGF